MHVCDTVLKDRLLMSKCYIAWEPLVLRVKFAGSSWALMQNYGCLANTLDVWQFGG